jgi:hypothetical protein
MSWFCPPFWRNKAKNWQSPWVPSMNFGKSAWSCLQSDSTYLKDNGRSIMNTRLRWWKPFQGTEAASEISNVDPSSNRLEGRSSTPSRGKILFSLHHIVQTARHTTLLQNGHVGLFPPRWSGRCVKLTTRRHQELWRYTSTPQYVLMVWCLIN